MSPNVYVSLGGLITAILLIALVGLKVTLNVTVLPIPVLVVMVGVTDALPSTTGVNSAA